MIRPWSCPGIEPRLSMIACTSWRLLYEQSLLQQPLHQLPSCSKAWYRLRCLKESCHSQLLRHYCQRIRQACALTRRFFSLPQSWLQRLQIYLCSQQLHRAVLHLRLLVTTQPLHHRCIPNQPHCLCHSLALKAHPLSCGSVSLRNPDHSFVKMTDYCFKRHPCFFWAYREMKCRRQCRFTFEGSLCRQRLGRCLFGFLKTHQRMASLTF